MHGCIDDAQNYFGSVSQHKVLRTWFTSFKDIHGENRDDEVIEDMKE